MKHVTFFLARRMFGGLTLAVIFLALGMTTTAWGQPIQEENFSYSTGQLTSVNGGANVSGGNWVNYSGTTLPLTVFSGSLSSTGYASSGIGNKVVTVPGSAEDAYRPFTTQTSGTVYAAFLINVTSTTGMVANTSTTGDYSIAFLPSTSTTSLDARVSFRLGTVAGTYNLGLRATSSNTASTFAPTDYSTGVTHLIVISYQFVAGATNDVMNMWIDPAIGGSEPAATLTQTGLAADLADVARLVIRQGTNSVNSEIDGIRVGTSWASVVARPAAPTVTTGSASSITISGATLNGTVNANGPSTTVNFEYGPTASYGTTTAATQSPIIGSLNQAVSLAIGSLTPNTEYHFRVTASNDSGSANGSDAMFTTPPSTPTADAATSVLGTSFTANWTAPTGGAASYTLEVALDNGFTLDWTGYPATGITDTFYSVTGLTPGTPFYYHVKAVGAGGQSSYSNTITLTTVASASNASDVIATPGFLYESSVSYMLYTGVSDITDLNSLAAAGVTVRDGGATTDSDPYSTVLTAITFSVSNSSAITRGALYDGTTELSEVALSGGNLAFSSLSVAVADGGTKDLVLRVVYNTTVTDGAQNVYTVTSVSANVDSSVFAAANGGGAVSSSAGDDNRLEVAATKLIFSPNVSNTPVSTNFSATAKAVDVNNNVDEGYGTDVLFSKNSGAGTLFGTTVVTPTAGIALTTNLLIDQGGTYTLRAASGILTDGVSNSFVVIQPGLFKVSNTGSPGDTLYWDNSASWVIERGANIYGTPQGSDTVIMDHTYRAGHYVMSTGPNNSQTPAMYDSCKLISIGLIGDSDPEKIELIIPTNGPTTPSGSTVYNFKFGDGTAGNYDFTLEGNGVFKDMKDAFARSVSYRALSDTMWIRTGGYWYHYTKGFNTMHRVLSRRFDGDYGTIEFDINGAISGTFDISGGGNYWYPNVVISNTHAFTTYFWFGTGATYIKGDLTINAGAKDSMMLAANAPFIVYGNVINNGILMSTSAVDGSPLMMRGASAQTISGTGTTQLGGGFIMMNPSGVTLSTDMTATGGAITTGGNVTWDSTGTNVMVTYPAQGVLSTGTNTVYLTGTSTLTEGNNPIQGNVSSTQTANTGSNQAFNNIGFEVNAAGAAPGVTTVFRKTGVAQSGFGGNQSIFRYYDVTPANNSGLNAALGFSFAPSELNSISEPALLLHKSTDGGTSWSGKSGTVNPALHKITAGGVQSLNARWTAASSTAPLFVPHTIAVTKVSDDDGDIFTRGDQIRKKWRLSLYQDSISVGSLIAAQTPAPGSLVVQNLEAGTYIATEGDSSSAGWITLGKIHHGVTVAGAGQTDTIVVSGGNADSAVFINQKTSGISIVKVQDHDGNASTTGDQTAKVWHLALYKGSVAPENLVSEVDASSLVATGLQAGTYIAVEADSGAPWVRLNGNYTFNDTIAIASEQVVADTFVNLKANSLTVRKFVDNDGNATSNGDRVAKGWGLEIRKGTVNGPIIVGNDAPSIEALNLGDGTYFAIEADSAGWVYLAQEVAGSHGTVTAIDSRTASIVLSDGQSATLDFINTEPIYGQLFRSFRPDSIVYDVDNKGKPRTAVKKKPLTDDFAFDIANPNAFAANLKLSFSMNVNGYVFDGPETLATLAAVKTVTVNAVDSVAALTVVGTGNKGKAIVVKYDWYNPATNKKISGQSGTVASYQYNNPRLPMPNRLNVLQEEQDSSAFSATSGLLVGVPQDDTHKKYLSWVLHKKVTDAVKSLYDKTAGIHSCDARGFDFKTNACAPDLTKMLKGKQGSLSPKTQNNSLFANLVALKVSIAASALGTTPVGFGELIYDDGGSNPYNGMMLKDVAAITDTLLTGYTTLDTTITDSVKNKIKVTVIRHFADSATYANLNTVISNAVSAFEGPVDTASWTTKLVMKGTVRLVDVPFLHADPSVVPFRIVPSKSVYATPVAYQLYQNYPNPFNPTTAIRFDLPMQSVVTLKVYNVLGQEVATLLNNEQMEDGMQEVEFNASNFASGVYFYRIIADGVNEDGITTSFVTVKKMMLMK